MNTIVASALTVSWGVGTTKEPGRGGEAMVRCAYGHLGQVRHRAEEVEYRIEAFHDKLKGRLAALRDAV